MMTIKMGRCQNMFMAKTASISRLLLVAWREGGPGEGVVDHHDVQHARDHGVNPAEFEELVAAGVDRVDRLLARSLLEVRDLGPQGVALRLAVFRLCLFGLAGEVVMVKGRPGDDADPELAKILRPVVKVAKKDRQAPP